MNDKPIGIPFYRFKRCHPYTLFLPGVFLVGGMLLYFTVPAQSTVSRFLPDQYRAIHWTENEGLSLGKKNIMLKDVNGFLWIVSPVGLNRFDGSTFKVYYPDKNTPGTIGGAYTFSLVEDSLHNIWIGTNKGVSRYDINADTFQNFSPRIVSVTSAATVIPFWATRDKVYCFETGNTIVSFDVHTFQKRALFAFTANKPERNNINIPNAIYEETSNSVWMLTGEGTENGGLVQVALNEGKTVNYQWICTKGIAEHVHYAYNMRLDRKRSCIWLNTVDGLLRFSLQDKQYHQVKACSDPMPLNNYEVIGGMAIDQKDKLWLYTEKKGIVVYDPATETAAPLFTDSIMQNRVSANNMSIYADKDGMIWCGYLSVKGICQLVPFAASVTRIDFPLLNVYPKMVTPFTAIAAADSGRLWVGTLDGLFSYDSRTGAKTAKAFSSIPSRRLTPLGVQPEKQKAWVATFEGSLYEVDLRTQQGKQVTVFDLNHQVLKEVWPDAATFQPYRDGFLFRVDKIGVFTLNTETAIAQQVIPVPLHVTNMAVAGDNRVFLRLHFGFTNLSFYEKNGRWQQTPTAMDSIEWFCIDYNRADSSYWVGGVKQLYHLDHQYRLLRAYTEKDGLPGIDVICLQKDDQGNIWFVNARGTISRIDSKTGLLSSLSEKDGYETQPFTWQAPHSKDRDGNIYFAGYKGVVRIEPQKVDSFPPSRVYFRSLSVNEKPVRPTTGSDGVARLSLRYFEMPLVIETGVVDDYAQGKVAIRYRLQELANRWQYAPANYVLRFEKLPPGRYHLVLQASGSANNFGGPEKILLIDISPAFWNTLWFRVGAGSLLCLLAYIFLRRRLKQQFHRRLENTEKERQLAELKHKATTLEMQVLRAQMNPHFIFNSLNSINRFILQNDKLQASEYLIKFSRLIRLILQNSQASLISLESELETLRLYLDLEAFRFHHHFDYKISVSQQLDMADLQVPPLILQPYVENAIWHGLMHRDEKGQLDIDLSEEQGFLYIKITDNGIGREKAALRGSKSATKHKSMGHGITAQRIAAFQQEGTGATPVVINDLVNDDGTPAGTEVILKLPVMYD